MNAANAYVVLLYAGRRALRLFELTWLFSSKTIILLLIDSRSIPHLFSISFSTNTAFKAGLTQFGQKQAHYLLMKITLLTAKIYRTSSTKS